MHNPAMTTTYKWFYKTPSQALEGLADLAAVLRGNQDYENNNIYFNVRGNEVAITVLPASNTFVTFHGYEGINPVIELKPNDFV